VHHICEKKFSAWLLFFFFRGGLNWSRAISETIYMEKESKINRDKNKVCCFEIVFFYIYILYIYML
jgi:hypothetical protein